MFLYVVLERSEEKVCYCGATADKIKIIGIFSEYKKAREVEDKSNEYEIEKWTLDGECVEKMYCEPIEII